MVQSSFCRCKKLWLFSAIISVFLHDHHHEFRGGSNKNFFFVSGYPCDGVTHNCTLTFGAFHEFFPIFAPQYVWDMGVLTNQAVIEAKAGHRYISSVHLNYPGPVTDFIFSGLSIRMELMLCGARNCPYVFEHMADLIGELNNGKGFGVKAGNAEETYFYKFVHKYHLLPNTLDEPSLESGSRWLNKGSYEAEIALCEASMNCANAVLFPPPLNGTCQAKVDSGWNCRDNATGLLWNATAEQILKEVPVQENWLFSLYDKLGKPSQVRRGSSTAMQLARGDAFNELGLLSFNTADDATLTRGAKDPETRNLWNFNMFLNPDNEAKDFMLQCSLRGLKKVGFLRWAEDGPWNRKEFESGVGATHWARHYGLEVSVDHNITQDKYSSRTAGDTDANGVTTNPLWDWWMRDFVRECVEKKVDVIYLGIHDAQTIYVAHFGTHWYDLWLLKLLQEVEHVHRFAAVFTLKVSGGSAVGEGPSGVVFPAQALDASLDRWRDPLLQNTNWKEAVVGPNNVPSWWDGPGGLFGLQPLGNSEWDPEKYVRTAEAGILSVVAQALQTFFEFRPVPDPPNLLRHGTDLYQQFRDYLNSGKKIGDTWLGPFSVDPATGMNKRGDGVTTVTYQMEPGPLYEAKLRLPLEHADHVLRLPSDAVTQTACSVDEFRDFTEFGVEVKRDVLEGHECKKCPPFTTTSHIFYTVLAEQEGNYKRDANRDECLCIPGYYTHATTTEWIPGSFNLTTRNGTRCPFQDLDRNVNKAKCTEYTCVSCDKGWFSAVPGSAECSKCPPGSAAPNAGMAQCDACPVGYFQDADAGLSCKVCPLGYYAESHNSTSCEKCPFQGATTALLGATSLDDCECQFVESDDYTNAFYHSELTNACEKCPEGMQCDKKARFTKERGFENMKVLLGFYLKEVAEPFEMYACHPDSKERYGSKTSRMKDLYTPCSGGTGTIENVLENRCKEGHDKDVLNCAQCAANHYRNDEGGCDECQDGDGWGLIFVLIVSVLGVPLIYYLVNGKATARVSNFSLICFTCGSLVTTAQMTSIVSRVSVNFPVSLDPLWSVSNIFALDIRSLKPECAYGNFLDSSTSYYTKISILVCLFAWLFLCSFVTRLIWKKEDADNGGAKFGWLRMELGKTFNTFGMLYQALFVTVLLIISNGLRCYEHPVNDMDKNARIRLSLNAYQDILCWDNASHQAMAGFSLLVSIPFLFCFLGYYAWMLTQLPKLSIGNLESTTTGGGRASRMGDLLRGASRSNIGDASKIRSSGRGSTSAIDRGARVTKSSALIAPFKFMLARFRLGCWFWGLVFLLRNLACSLGTTIISHPFDQCGILISVYLLYLVFLCYLLPWRSMGLNFLDMSQVVCVTMMMCGSMSLIGEVDEETQERAAVVIACSFILAVSIVVVLLGRVILDEVRFQLNPAYKARIESQTRLARERAAGNLMVASETLSALGLEKIGNVLLNLDNVDLWKLESMANTVIFELAGSGVAHEFLKHGHLGAMRIRGNDIEAEDERRKRIESNESVTQLIDLVQVNKQRVNGKLTLAKSVVNACDEAIKTRTTLIPEAQISVVDGGTNSKEIVNQGVVTPEKIPSDGNNVTSTHAADPSVGQDDRVGDGPNDVEKITIEDALSKAQVVVDGEQSSSVQMNEYGAIEI